MCKTCWTLVLVLSIAVAGMAYKFIIAGDAILSSDGRQAIQLSDSERNLVLTEMRTFLSSAQAITLALTTEDMGQVAKAARIVGAAAQQAVPGSLIGKLPLEFKKLGFDTHQKFDQLALDAEQLGDREYTMKQLAELMNNCVACHATYRFEPGEI
ncbi:MAG: hypothetical protein OEY89_12860 [Gammaproteobacteria bacterium]|nr:hypothetical protein [Gammaproteobacteria bacterium]